MDNRPNPMGRKRPILETVRNMTIIFFALSAIAALYNFALAARVLIYGSSDVRYLYLHVFI